MGSSHRLVHRALFGLTAVAAVVVAGCACGAGSGGGSDAGPRPDAGSGDGSASDASAGDGGGAAGDGGSDAGPDLCMSVTCGLFERCVRGTCMPYPACAGDGSCPEGEVCHARRCVPVDVDVDGDGSPAGRDCDETDPRRSPDLPEVCNGFDDDCNRMVDDGDPTALCASNPGGGVCMAGSCGCPPGTFDLDRAVPGCECTATPPLTDGNTCPTAIDLGMLRDTGERLTVTGNVLPDDREVWYRFVGVDTPDTSCDNFHVRVQLTDNPGDAFEFTVYRGSCDMVGCSDTGFSDYRWATDLRSTPMPGTIVGQCPCSTSADPASNLCGDDSATFFVRVRRKTGSTLACASYTIELSNGLYDS